MCTCSYKWVHLYLSEECGKKFKGKAISRLVSKQPGNESRTMWKHVRLPLATWRQYSIAEAVFGIVTTPLVRPLQIKAEVRCHR